LGPGGFGPATFTNASLSLPLETTGRPIQLSVRASAVGGGILLLRLGGVAVGSIPVWSGEPDWHTLDIPSPPPGRGLDLALALTRQPRAPGLTAEEPLLFAPALEIVSPRGLALRAWPCVLVACFPIAFFGLAWLLWRPSAAAFAAVILSAALALLAAHVAPLHFVRIAPPALAMMVAAGVVMRLPLAETATRASRGGGREWMWAAGLALLPAVEISILLYAFFRRSLLDHVPGVVNDAIDYWLEAQAFWFAGFRGGYFTVDERPAPASFSHLGCHGPLFPMIHGLLGRLIGWHRWSIPVVHLALVAVALLFFARRASRDGRGRVLIPLCLATSWPALLLLPTSLQEGLHIAVSVFLAGALRRPLDGRAMSVGMGGAVLAVLATACLIRPSWGLLFPAVLALMFAGASWRRRAVAAAAGVVLWAALIAAFAYTAAPYGREEFTFVKVARLEERASALLTRTETNARRLVAGSALEVQSRLMAAGLALAAGAAAWRARPRRELLLHAYNLGSILLALFFTYVYGLWIDFRVFGPHLLLTVLLLATSPLAVARRLALIALCAQAGSAGPFVEAFREFSASYRYDAARIDAFAAAARRALVFDAGQDAWCNTLVSVNPPYFYPEMVGLPPGLGVTMLFGRAAPPPTLRSRYVLLDSDDSRPWALGTPTVRHLAPDHVHVTLGGWLSLDLQPLAPTPIGELYQNLDAHCPAR